MAPPDPTNDATRKMLFELSRTVVDRIIRHTGDASAKLEREDEEGVLDSLYDLQVALSLFRSLMEWAQNLNPEKEKTA